MRSWRSWLSVSLKDPEKLAASIWLVMGSAALVAIAWAVTTIFIEQRNDRIAQNIIISVMPVVLAYFATYFFVFRTQLTRIREVIDAASSEAIGPTQAETDGAGAVIENTRGRVRLAFRGAVLLVLFSVGFQFLRYLPAYVSIIPDALLQRAIVLTLVALSVGILFCIILVNNTIVQARLVLVARSKIIASISEGKVPDSTLLGERDEKKYQQNLSSTFKLKHFELRNAGIFRDLSWDLEPGVNVLLGRNGFGKSYLLRLFVGMISYDNDRLGKLLANPDEDQLLAAYLLRNDAPETIERDKSRFIDSVGKVPLLAIPDSRFVNRTQKGVGNPGNDFADLARHGAYHFLYEIPYDTTIQTVLFEMCIDAVARGKRASPQLDLVCEVIRELSGEQFRFSRIERIGSGLFSIQVETDSSPGKPILLQEASQGTLSIVAICLLIYQFLRAVYWSIAEAKLCEQHGIVIIDEVDAHLHPAWQRQIAHLLRKHFPNIQFILTAHSPLVVAGCGSGEVAVLRRENSDLKIVDFQIDFVGATPQDIYRNLFEIEDLDVKFLELQADLPRLPRLYRELDSLKEEKNPNEERISRLKENIRSIERTRVQKKLDYESLEQENEQLRRRRKGLEEEISQLQRQLDELQKRDGSGVA